MPKSSIERVRKLRAKKREATPQLPPNAPLETLKDPSTNIHNTKEDLYLAEKMTENFEKLLFARNFKCELQCVICRMVFSGNRKYNRVRHIRLCHKADVANGLIPDHKAFLQQFYSDDAEEILHHIVHNVDEIYIQEKKIIETKDLNSKGEINESYADSLANAKHCKHLCNGPFIEKDSAGPPEKGASKSDSDSNRVRNILTLEERVAVISQYDIYPMYSKIAKNFNCSWEQIKNIVANRDSILKFHEAASKLKSKPIEDFSLRRNKLNFLGHCLYEYIQRAQYYLNTEINEEFLRNKALEFRSLFKLDGFVPSKSWLNHFKARYNISLSNRQIALNRRPPRSLNLKDIMSYCGRNKCVLPSTLLHIPNSSSEASSSVSDRPLYRTKTLMEASSQNQATCDEVMTQRRRKINFLEKCLYEYTERWVVHKQGGRIDIDNLRTVANNLKDILKIENFIPDKMWLNHFKSHYGFSFSVGVQTTNRVRLSLDLWDIVSYCSRYDAPRLTVAIKKPEAAIPSEDTDEGNNFCKDAEEGNNFCEDPEEGNNFCEDPEEGNNFCEDAEEGNNFCEDAEDEQNFCEDAEDENNFCEDVEEGNKEPDENNDDCVTEEIKQEFIDIKDEDYGWIEDDNQISAQAAKRNMEDNTDPCPLKIQKIQSLHESDSIDKEIPSAPSPGHYSETSDEAHLPTCVENYKDALRLLKPLEEFVLMEENYRAIGLLTQLEQIFESMAKKQN